MTKTLEKAVAVIGQLPDSDQDEIGQQLLAHVEKLGRLRTDLDRGIRSLDAGLGREVDIEAVIARKNKENGK